MGKYGHWGWEKVDNWPSISKYKEIKWSVYKIRSISLKVPIFLKTYRVYKQVLASISKYQRKTMEGIGVSLFKENKDIVDEKKSKIDQV